MYMYHPCTHVYTGQECLHGFALSETCSGNVNTCSRELGNQYHVRLFPSLSFTCNGTLSGWSATGCTQGDDPRLYPWLQIWRPEGAMSYSRVASESGDCSSAEYLDCTFQPAISIMADDVVGLVLFTKNSANFRVYFSNSEPKTTNYIFYDETATSVMFTDGSEDRPPLIAMDFTCECLYMCIQCLTFLYIAAPSCSCACSYARLYHSN